MSTQELRVLLAVSEDLNRRAKDQLALELVQQLLQGGLRPSVVSDQASIRPEVGTAKGLELFSPEGIALTAASLQVLRQGVRIVEVWLKTGAKRTIRLEFDGNVLELSGPRSEQDQGVIQQWIDLQRRPDDG